MLVQGSQANELSNRPYLWRRVCKIAKVAIIYLLIKNIKKKKKLQNTEWIFTIVQKPYLLDSL